MCFKSQQQVIKELKLLVKFVISYKNKEKFSTFIGGLTSIFIILIILSVAVLFGQNMYLRLNPQIISQVDKTSDYPNVTLNTSNHILGINFFDGGHYQNLSQYFIFETISFNNKNELYILHTRRQRAGYGSPPRVTCQS